MDFSNILMYIIGIIFIFAIFDLIVGVSNDAINFLSPSIGSKASSYKNILIIAGLGLLIGALFSSGLMEVARKGIFHPQYFNLVEITILFLAVIVADILLLDRFNSLGMPTSTTVSIVFCLLGSAVAIGVIKVNSLNLPMSELSNYINTAKVLVIILGILGSVIASFILGTIIQYIVRMVFTFNYQEKPKYWSAILGAIAITAITHFILAKGLKGSALDTKELISWVNSNLLTFLSITFVVWFFILEVMLFFKANIFKIVVLIGTFSLAMAFAGNDLVNFIGVPLAALKSYSLFTADPSIVDPNLFFMDGLNKKEKANIFLLLTAGGIMVLTMIFSKKAKRVLNTGLDLSRQNEGKENFGTSYISRAIVRKFILLIKMSKKITPKLVWVSIGKRFETVKNKGGEHTFDLVRASVILICSSILISIATSYKLPLSTTYVTFMVAMGAAFADRSWGRESAVYRVNGVISVIFGWFLTAFGAFIFAFAIANFIYFGGVFATVLVIILVFFIMLRPLFKKEKEVKNEDIISSIEKFDSFSEGFLESIKQNLNLGRKYFSGITRCLGKEDISKAKKINSSISIFKDNIYDFKRDLIINVGELDSNKFKRVKFLSTYVGILNSMKDYSKSLTFIGESITEYVDNNHTICKTEIKALNKINTKIDKIYKEMFLKIDKKDFGIKFKSLKEFIKELDVYIEEDIERVKVGDINVQCSIFYISIINETKHMLLGMDTIYRRCGELDL